MKKLFYRLIIFLDTADDNDTNYNIGWYLAHHFSQIATMGISELAKNCYVSPATISRFCRALGYENYAHLKQECAEFSSDMKKFTNLIDVDINMMTQKPQEATSYFCDKVTDVIEELPNYLKWNEIDKVLNLIHETESVAFFGTQFSQSIALHFQTDLLMLEKFTMAYLDDERQLNCAQNLDSDSLAIIISVNGLYLNSANKTMAYLKKSHCKVVLITCNPDCEDRMDLNIVHRIIIGDKAKARVGKHALLTTIELMSLRYYSLFYPNVLGSITK